MTPQLSYIYIASELPRDIPPNSIRLEIMQKSKCHHKLFLYTIFILLK